ncbi:hypothetical protein JCM33374_g5585 [Metschnikowia sp. JCM 33374]|nr:hypothetical protein JCM33374_g5585 [Metschnikowia sp. JCM 33374]
MLGILFLNLLSRKALFSILLVILFVQALILTSFQVLGPLQEVDTALSAILSSIEFHRKAAMMLAKVDFNKDRFWLAHSDLVHLEAEVPIDQILVREDRPGPNENFYDPRLTISVYLEELRRIGNTPKLPTLPFHWVDWTDVSLLNPNSGFDQDKIKTCHDLQSHIHGNPHFSLYCKDRDGLSDDEIETLGYRNKEQLPKAVVFDHCPHENPAFNDVRVFMAKSYAMSYLPKPSKVIILNHGERTGTYEFMVSQNTSSDQRLLYSGMTERFVQSVSGMDAMAALENGGTFKFNPREVFNNLSRSVHPRHLSDDADVMNMHWTVKSRAGSDKDLSLQKENFDYPKEVIQKQIEEYEAIAERDILQQNYLDGLKHCAQYNGQNEPMYFKMAVLDINEHENSNDDWGWHYDWRFFNDALFYEKKDWTKAERVERTNIILERLLRNWNRFAEEKGIVSWIMHGPLLSWYWDGLMFPYDVDIDIQMPISELTRLAREYNQTLVIENPSEGYGRYLIDVGTYIHNRDMSDTGNHIDARFVDVDSGVSIDITGLAKSSSNLSEENLEEDAKNDGDASAAVYNDRRKHSYTLSQISPLHYSMLGGVPVYIPSAVERMLRLEFKTGLDEYEFHDWYFVPKLQLWIMKNKLAKLFNEEDYLNHEKHFDIQKMVACVKAMNDEEGLRLLKDDEILSEYYLTSRFTNWHLLEKSLLLTTDGKDNITALEEPRARQRYNRLVGKVKFSKPFRKDLFEYERFDRLAHHSDGATSHSEAQQ